MRRYIATNCAMLLLVSTQAPYVFAHDERQSHERDRQERESRREDDRRAREDDQRQRQSERQYESDQRQKDREYERQREADQQRQRQSEREHESSSRPVDHQRESSQRPAEHEEQQRQRQYEHEDQQKQHQAVREDQQQQRQYEREDQQKQHQSVREDQQKQRQYEHEDQQKQHQYAREEQQKQHQYVREAGGTPALAGQKYQSGQRQSEREINQKSASYERESQQHDSMSGAAGSFSQSHTHNSSGSSSNTSPGYFSQSHLQSSLGSGSSVSTSSATERRGGLKQDSESVPLHLIGPSSGTHLAEPGQISSPAKVSGTNVNPARINTGASNAANAGAGMVGAGPAAVGAGHGMVLATPGMVGASTTAVGVSTNSQGSLFSTASVLPPQFNERPQVLPAMTGMKYLPFHQAYFAPVQPPRISVLQQADIALAERNLQQNLLVVSASQIPVDFAEMKLFQSTHYFNNYATTIGGQPITINPTNSYVKPAPRNQWPPGYQPTDGFNIGNGFLLGSLFANLNWLLWGWPSAYGVQPNSFIYAEGYFPTPWIYVTWANRWRVHGQQGYVSEGPPADYTMPISVEVIESLRTMSGGGAIPKKTNQLFLYNAFYYPAYGRWGYKNRMGNFVWLNPQRVNVGGVMGL